VFFTGAARVDGSSAFGEGFKAAVYPKASISWLVSDEPFWPSALGFLSIRMRAAYGESGVQPGAVAALASELLFPAFVDGAATTASELGGVGNRDLRPERQTGYEGGIDAQVLNGRITVAATLYRKQSTDALVNVPVQASFGGGSRWENVGSVRNKGYELSVMARVFERQILHVPVKWSVSASASVNDNTVREIAPGVDAQYFGAQPSIVRGYPIYSYFFYPITHADDGNHDGILEPGEIVIGDSLAYLGRSYPRLQGTFHSSLALWRGRVRLAASLERRAGYRIFNNALLVRCNFAACRGSVDPAASLSEKAAFLGYRGGLARSTTAGFVEDGTFTRLRDVSVSYALSPGLVRDLHVSEATITLSGRNLALWTSYSGADPEVQTIFGSNEYGAAVDQGGIPPATYWLLRISVGF
jgi:outer membrane receptor protein involved in Fe transport